MGGVQLWQPQKSPRLNRQRKRVRCSRTSLLCPAQVKNFRRLFTSNQRKSRKIQTIPLACNRIIFTVYSISAVGGIFMPIWRRKEARRMGGRGSGSRMNPYYGLSTSSIEQQLSLAQEKNKKARRDRLIYADLRSSNLSSLARKAKAAVTRANKTIDETDRQISLLEAALKRAKRRNEDIPF